MMLEPDKYKRVWQDGRVQGLADIAAGRPKFYWNTRSFWGEFMTTLFAERFRVTVEHVGCITTEHKSIFEAGYNRATADHIDAIFGTGAYQATLDEVQKHRLEVYKR